MPSGMSAPMRPQPNPFRKNTPPELAPAKAGDMSVAVGDRVEPAMTHPGSRVKPEMPPMAGAGCRRPRILPKTGNTQRLSP